MVFHAPLPCDGSQTCLLCKCLDVSEEKWLHLLSWDNKFSRFLNLNQNQFQNKTNKQNLLSILTLIPSTFWMKHILKQLLPLKKLAISEHALSNGLKKSKQKLKMKDFISKCHEDFILILETVLWVMTARLDVQDNFMCSNLHAASSSLFQRSAETCMHKSLAKKYC